MALSLAQGGGNERALQSRRRTSKSATSQDGSAQEPHYEGRPRSSSAARKETKVALLARERLFEAEQQRSRELAGVVRSGFGMSGESIQDWLKEVGLEKYAPVFAAHEIKIGRAHV